MQALIILRQRVVLQHQITQSFVEHMGVNLGRGNISVTQQCLDRTQISTIGQQMRGEGVAQCVRRYISGVKAWRQVPIV